MVKAIICDIKDCGAKIASIHNEDEANKLSLTKATDGFSESYDLCNNCVKKVERLINAEPLEKSSNKDFRVPARKGRKTKADQKEEEFRNLVELTDKSQNPKKKWSPWTKEEDQYIINNPQMSAKQIGLQLGRTADSIYVRKSKLKKKDD